MPPGRPATVFRLPALAYLVVLFLLFGAIPLAFTRDGIEGEQAIFGWQALVLLVPAVAAVFIARTATIVDDAGMTLRAAFGKRRFAWNDIRGLSVTGRSVYVVLADGAVRLPCVRVADLGTLSRASGQHLPEIADATPKYAPQPRRRRR